MIQINTLSHCGIEYYNPADIKPAQKAQYWQMSARIMQELGYQGISEDPENTKSEFKKLPSSEQDKILYLQRLQMIRTLKEGWDARQNITMHRSDNIMPFSLMLLCINDLYEPNTKKYNVQKLFADYKNTSHSHKNKNIAEVFSDKDRLYLPMKQFFSDPLEKGDCNIAVKDQAIVVSRHPYDLMRMSTARPWDSCMDVKEQTNYGSFVWSDIKLGTVIAYAIHSPDNNPLDTDWNITVPIARCLLKPFISNGRTIMYQRDKVFGEVKNQPFKSAMDTITREWFGREGIEGKDYYTYGTLYDESLGQHFECRKEHISSYPVTIDSASRQIRSLKVD